MLFGTRHLPLKVFYFLLLQRKKEKKRPQHGVHKGS